MAPRRPPLRSELHRGTAPRKPVDWSHSRRRFLQGLGGAAMLAPFLPLTQIEAADGEYPLRLLVVFSPNGTLHEHWAPTGTETDFQLGPLLAPLETYKDKLVILDGLEVLRPGPGDGHQKGMALLWTGNEILEGDQFEGGNGELAGWGGGISVDQFVADNIDAPTAYRSLEFGVQTGGADLWSRMTYAGPDQPIAPEDNPGAAFERVFADFDVDETALVKLKAERRSVIDHVKGDLGKLRERYGKDDQLKLDAHLEAMLEIEKRNEAAVPSCQIPELATGLDHGANENFPAVSRLQIELIKQVFACDLTRVASLQWSRSVSNTRHDWIDVPDGHHDLSHLGDGDPAMIDKISKINVWYAEEFKAILDALASVPEGDGTMLDNTLVVWGNELSRGNSHGNHPVPFVLAGGAAGRIQTGRYLKFDREPHNRLLVSICRAMGLDETETFGNIDPGAGGLAGLG